VKQLGKMKIGLDFDGVIADCGALKSAGAKELFGVDIPPAKFKKEIVTGTAPGYPQLLTPDQYRAVQKWIYGTPFGLAMQMLPGLKEGLEALRRMGNELAVLTLRGEEDNTLQIAQQWMRIQGLKLPMVGLGHSKKKDEAARQMKLDVYIDDDLEKLVPLVGVVAHRFLMSWGYNEGDDEGTVARRVTSWPEFVEQIRQLHLREIFGDCKSLPPHPVIPPPSFWHPPRGPRYRG